MEAVRKDGSLIILSSDIRAILNDKGEIHFLDGFCVDITDHKKTEEELKKYRENLEKLVAERTQQLVQAVLVLPLASIDGMPLGDRQRVGRGIDHRRAREYVVADSAAEDVHHELDVFRAIGADVVHAVERFSPEHGVHRTVIGAIADQPADGTRERRLGLPAVHDRHGVAGARQLPDERKPVELRPTPHEDLPAPSPLNSPSRSPGI